MATEQEVYDAGGHECLRQNLNISYVFWILNKIQTNNGSHMKKIIDFIKGLIPFLNKLYSIHSIQVHSFN